MDPVERGVDGEAVIVRGDLDLARRAVDDGLVDTSMAVLELVRREAESAPEQLVAEADAEVRDAALKHSAQHVDRVIGRGRVARAIRVEDSVGL